MMTSAQTWHMYFVDYTLHGPKGDMGGNIRMTLNQPWKTWEQVQLVKQKIADQAPIELSDPNVQVQIHNWEFLDTEVQIVNEHGERLAELVRDLNDETAVLKKVDLPAGTIITILSNEGKGQYIGGTTDGELNFSVTEKDFKYLSL